MRNWAFVHHFILILCGIFLLPPWTSSVVPMIVHKFSGGPLVSHPLTCGLVFLSPPATVNGGDPMRVSLGLLLEPLNCCVHPAKGKAWVKKAAERESRM